MKITIETLKKIINEEIEKVLTQESYEDLEKEMSRRDFLKKIGGGAAAAAVTGAAAGMLGQELGQKAGEETRKAIDPEDPYAAALKRNKDKQIPKGALPIQDPRLPENPWEEAPVLFHDKLTDQGMVMSKSVWIPPNKIPDSWSLMMAGGMTAGEYRDIFRKHKTISAVESTLFASRSAWSYTDDKTKSGEGGMGGAAMYRYPGPDWTGDEKGPQPELYDREMIPPTWSVLYGVYREKLLAGQDWLGNFVPTNLAKLSDQEMEALMDSKYTDMLVQISDKLGYGSDHSKLISDWEAVKDSGVLPAFKQKAKGL